MGMITSRVESVCCMCNLAPGRGRWSLCRACSDKIADQIYRKLGTAWQATCAACGEQNVIAGRLCLRCQAEMREAQNEAPQPAGGEKAKNRPVMPPLDV
jgi:hypothetical protein